MRRRDKSKKITIIGVTSIAVLVLTLFIVTLATHIQNQKNYLTPLVTECPSDPKDATPYQTTFREAYLMSLSLNDVILQSNEGNLTYEQYVEFADTHNSIIKDFITEATIHNRIPVELIKSYNDSVRAIWGPKCIYLIDEKRDDRDINAWVDGHLFYYYDYCIWVKWVSGDISDEEYYTCAEKTKWQNLYDENLSSDKIWEIIEYMYGILSGEG